MRIVTPTEITSVAWEGELVGPPMMGVSERAPVVTLGQHEIWTAAQAMETEVGKKWTPPLGGADFWLVRLACTIREPGGGGAITEATQTLYLRPKNSAADEKDTYAHSLFPERLGVDENTEINIGLLPDLKFAGVEIKVGKLDAKITYRKVFPVIQSYDVGTPTPCWVFRPHLAHPLQGSQFVYAVVAAKTGAGGVRASVELAVTAETRFGPVRFGLPEEAKAHTSFTIP